MSFVFEEPYPLFLTILGGTTFMFALVLAMALAGIGIGGGLYARWRGAALATSGGLAIALAPALVLAPEDVTRRIYSITDLNDPTSRDRVVTCEEVFELKVPLPDVVSMQTRQANLEGQGEIDLRRLIMEALRMRQDRLIVGEVRQRLARRP